MTRKRPSRWHYLWVAAILAGGWSVAGLEAWRLGHAGAGLMLARAPGETSLALPAGSYKIYHEFAGVIDDAMYFHSMLPAGLALGATGDAGGSITMTLVSNPRPAYRLGIRRGIPVASFALAQPGEVRLSIALAEGEPDTYFSVGDGRAEIVYGRFVRMMWLTLATTAAALAVWLWIVLKRFRPPGER